MSGGRLVRSVLSAAALVVYLLMAAAAEGQARYAGTGPGSVVTVGGMASGFQIDYGSRYLGGGAVYVDLNPSWRYGLEGEARLLRFNQQAEVRESTFLAGPRISFGSRRLNPYAKVLAGLGRFNFPYSYAYGNYLVLAPGAGVDYRVSRRVRLRLVDFEYQDWPRFTFGAIRPYGVSAGVSVALMRSGTKMGN